jgi:hypothetical protein
MVITIITTAAFYLWKEPETGQRLMVKIACQDNICEQSLLFICLRNGHFTQVHQSVAIKRSVSK